MKQSSSSQSSALQTQLERFKHSTQTPLTMCCRKNRQRYFEQQALYSPPARGCCGQRRALLQTSAQNTYSFFERPTMVSLQCTSCTRQLTDMTKAGLLAISLGLGAEKLGRTISEKRLERKEKKAIAVCSDPETLIMMSADRLL